MIGAIILGLLAGGLARLIVPGDNNVEGCLPTLLLGLGGALLGWLFFTKLLGIGDGDIFDLGGLIGAVIGSAVLLFAWGAIASKSGSS
ncbi:MAG: GlsB/YeaQ/YmgE family stress response membrane protein [Microthrixaceae bacterium]